MRRRRINWKRKSPPRIRERKFCYLYRINNAKDGQTFQAKSFTQLKRIAKKILKGDKTARVFFKRPTPYDRTGHLLYPTEEFGMTDKGMIRKRAPYACLL